MTFRLALYPVIDCGLLNSLREQSSNHLTTAGGVYSNRRGGQVARGKANDSSRDVGEV